MPVSMLVEWSKIVYYHTAYEVGDNKPAKAGEVANSAKAKDKTIGQKNARGQIFMDEG